MPALEQAASENMPTLTDLGYEGLAGPALRMPVKKTTGVELSEAHKQYNLIVRGVHGVTERANSLLKTPSKPCDESPSAHGGSARSPRPPPSYSTSNTTAPARPSHNVMQSYAEWLTERRRVVPDPGRHGRGV
jgi:hypothetical protein